MAWRGLHISRPASLRLKHRRLEVDGEDGTLQFPIEDIAWIVLDTPQVTTSAALLSACMEAGVLLVVSDKRHMPCGTLLPFHQHFRQAEVAHLQIVAPAGLKRRLWRTIVRRKIGNQADALDEAGGEGAATLREMTRHVRSGDAAAVEARAARYYWPRLFGEFRRHDETDRRNALLNYGYAVMRAAIARSLVAHGFLPAFGIHHESLQNAFNLADDLIEPYRPFVDRMVHARCASLGEGAKSGSMDLEDRQAMAAVLSTKASSDGDQVTMLTAVDRTVGSLQRAISAGQAKELVLPRLAG